MMLKGFLVAAAILLSLVPLQRVDGETQPRIAEETTAEIGQQDPIGVVARRAQQSVVVITVTDRDGGQQSIGTGFVVSRDGIVATNLHVIGEARPISVQFADGTKHSVTSVHATDRTLDLALVRIDAHDLPALELGRSDQVKPGEPIVVLGNPLGLKHSIVQGVISGKRELDGKEMLQLAIPIERGNSGGPVIDRHGRVQGVVTIKSQLTENLGFAMPIDALQALLDRPNPVPMSRWLTIGALDPKQWSPLFGARWQQRAGRIVVRGVGRGFGGRSLCLAQIEIPKLPYEVAVTVRLADESGAAGLVFHSDGGQMHYGFYPSNGRLRLSRFDGPDVFTWNILDEVRSKHYRPGDWNHLKVRIDSGAIRCFVNDHLVIQSTDDALTSGRIGLAKFRHTIAEFKGFEAAQQIPPSQPSPEIVNRIVKIIDTLRPRDKMLAEDIQLLSRDVPSSSLVIREHAKRLAQKAAELESLAVDVHVTRVVNDLTRTLKGQDETINLSRAALLVAQLDNEEIDVDAYLEEVARIAAKIRDRLAKDVDENTRLESLNNYLFVENGFHGSRTNYYHPANSYLNQVIDDREGLPITLSVLYMELGRRLGLKLEGVGLPGHFVVRYVPSQGEHRLIDVFDGGKMLSTADAALLVRNSSGRFLQDQHLDATDERSMIVRMLHNLWRTAERTGEKRRMLRYLEAMVAVDPTDGRHRAMRSVLLLESGRRAAAMVDLEWILENRPPDVDLDFVRNMRDALLK